MDKQQSLGGVENEIVDNMHVLFYFLIQVKEYEHLFYGYGLTVGLNRLIAQYPLQHFIFIVHQCNDHC
jgi:hypothetical protein